MNIVIVDEHDNQIGLKQFGTLQYEDIYRVTALWLTDSNTGDILIAQRKWTKTNDPGKWSASVSGTVDEGETYDTNIIKEIGEEIGLINLELVTGPKEYIDDGKHRYFIQWFLANVDKNAANITIQEEEVEAVEWVSRELLLADVRNDPDKYTPSFAKNLAVLGYEL